MKDSFDIAVIGGGGAGAMAYLRSVLNFDDTVWFLGDADTTRAARATWVAEVDNIPGMHGIKSPIRNSVKSTIEWVKGQPALASRSTVVRGRVTQLERCEDGFLLQTNAKKGPESYRAKYVILATGVMDRQPAIEGSIEPVFPFANRGDLIYCIRCDGHRTIGHSLAVIGPPSSAVPIARLMRERYRHQAITVLTHGGSDAMSKELSEMAAQDGTEVRQAEIQAILAGDDGALRGFRLSDGTEQPATKAIVALGTIVYNELAQQLGVELAEDGRIPVSSVGESSVRDLFVVGDLVAGKKMQVYTGWDEAVDAADRINARLRAARRSAA